MLLAGPAPVPFAAGASLQLTVKGAAAWGAKLTAAAELGHHLANPGDSPCGVTLGSQGAASNGPGKAGGD